MSHVFHSFCCCSAGHWALQSIYRTTIICRSFSFSFSFLFLDFVFECRITRIAFLLAYWHEHNRTGSMLKILPSLALHSQWQLLPPKGKLINYGWMFDWQRLNDSSSVLTSLPHTKNLVPIVLLKTCQIITTKLLIAAHLFTVFGPGRCQNIHVNYFMKDKAQHNEGRKISEFYQRPPRSPGCQLKWITSD